MDAPPFRFGDPGHYRISALTDPALTSAVDAFAEASSLLEGRKP